MITKVRAPENGGKRKRRRITRDLPLEVYELLRAVADDLYGGDISPVLCNAIRREHRAHEATKAAEKAGSDGDP